MIRYAYNEADLAIHESKDGDDYSFRITLKNPAAFPEALHRIRDYFNRDNIHTDVVFSALSEHEYRFLVRADYYTDFVLALFKYRLLSKLEQAD